MTIAVYETHTEITPEGGFYTDLPNVESVYVSAQRTLGMFYLDVGDANYTTVITVYLTEAEARAIATAWGLI